MQPWTAKISVWNESPLVAKTCPSSFDPYSSFSDCIFMLLYILKSPSFLGKYSFGVRFERLRSPIAPAYATAAGPFPPNPFVNPMLDCWAFEFDAPELDPDVPELEPENPPWDPPACWPYSLIKDVPRNEGLEIFGWVEQWQCLSVTLSQSNNKFNIKIVRFLMSLAVTVLVCDSVLLRLFGIPRWVSALCSSHAVTALICDSVVFWLFGTLRQGCPLTSSQPVTMLICDSVGLDFL